MRGEVDMIGIMLPLEAPIVHQLFVDESIQAFDWLRADAHVALRPYLSKLVLPRGVADLPRDRPAKDLTLVATKTSLVVRRDLHPAIQYLLLEAASEVHGAPGVFNKAGQFPAAEPIDLPLSTFAHEYYRSGQPFLQRHLPFWLAALTIAAADGADSGRRAPLSAAPPGARVVQLDTYTAVSFASTVSSSFWRRNWRSAYPIPPPERCPSA